MGSNTLWLVTARGGSKGVPGKNLRCLGGLSLIEWKIRAARAADPAAQIVCSSDSVDILMAATELDVAVIERPAELATDTATSASVIRHAVETLATDGSDFDQIVLCEPSAPFSHPEQYKSALAMMRLHDADLVVGMRETAPHTNFIGDMRGDGSITPIIIQFQRQARRRQDFPKQWSMSGGLYVFKTKMFMENNDLYAGSRNFGLLQDVYTGHEIDTMHDLELAEFYVERGRVKPCT